MKKYLFLSVLAVGILVSSCGSKGQNKIEGSNAQERATANGDTLAVNTTTSVINWKGFKPGGGHHGTIALKSGEITVGSNNNEVAGSFIVDMNTIDVKDLDLDNGKEALEKHLKSADFFDVETYPESKFTITKVKPVTNDTITHIISGNLKLKDVEKNISFGAKVSKEDNGYKAVSVPFTIDRTQWNVKYGSKTIFSELKDNIINDDIELQITIEAQTANK